jgi:hypothetical protein
MYLIRTAVRSQEHGWISGRRIMASTIMLELGSAGISLLTNKGDISKTVLLGEYSGRTKHIHVNASKMGGSPAITSQLFFPEGRLNTTDRIYDESLLAAMGKDSGGKKIGFFNFRLTR